MLSLGDALVQVVAAATTVPAVLPLKSTGETPQYVYVCHRTNGAAVVDFVFVKPFSSTETAPVDAVLMPVPESEPVLLFTGGCDRIQLRNTHATVALLVTVTPLENA